MVITNGKYHQQWTEDYVTILFNVNTTLTKIKFSVLQDTHKFTTIAAFLLRFNFLYHTYGRKIRKHTAISFHPSERKWDHTYNFFMHSMEAAAFVWSVDFS